MEEKEEKVKCSYCKQEFTKKEDVEFIKNSNYCVQCYIYIQEMEKENTIKRMIVTRDMALDAEMPEIEGGEING